MANSSSYGDEPANKPLRARNRFPHATSPQLKELRQLSMVVMHPDDSDGRLLTQQLQRIGCSVQTIWPPTQNLPSGTDLVFLAVQPDLLHLRLDWICADEAPTIIAVVNYENPTIVSAVLDLNIQAILPAPIRSFGLLSTVVLARKYHKELRQQRRLIDKLQTKLMGQRHVAQAKTILMRTHQVSEERAYDLIREQAMNKRSTIEDISIAIVNASEVLSLGQKGSSLLGN